MPLRAAAGPLCWLGRLHLLLFWVFSFPLLGPLRTLIAASQLVTTKGEKSSAFFISSPPPLLVHALAIRIDSSVSSPPEFLPPSSLPSLLTAFASLHFGGFWPLPAPRGSLSSTHLPCFLPCYLTGAASQYTRKKNPGNLVRFTQTVLSHPTIHVRPVEIWKKSAKSELNGGFPHSFLLNVLSQLSYFPLFGAQTTVDSCWVLVSAFLIKRDVNESLICL